MAFSYLGLRELELARESLVEFSPEFSQGMKARKDILGDQGPSDPSAWDPIWQDNQTSPHKNVHILISLNGLMPAVAPNDLAAIAVAHEASQKHRNQAYAWLQSVVAEHADGAGLAASPVRPSRSGAGEPPIPARLSAWLSPAAHAPVSGLLDSDSRAAIPRSAYRSHAHHGVRAPALLPAPTSC